MLGKLVLQEVVYLIGLAALQDSVESEDLLPTSIERIVLLVKVVEDGYFFARSDGQIRTDQAFHRLMQVESSLDCRFVLSNRACCVILLSVDQGF